MITVICQFHDGMRVCVRLDDRMCSGWFAVEQGLHQGCVLASLLFDIFFAAVINVGDTRFKVDKDIMEALVHLRKKKGTGGGGKATAGETVLATLLWGMLYADDAGVVSQSPEKLRKMRGVIVVVYAAFGLAVSEAKTEIVCLCTKGVSESTAIFSVEAAGQVYNQTDEFVYLRGNVNHMLTCPSRLIGAYATYDAASRSIPPNCTTDRALTSSSKSGCPEPKYLRQYYTACVTWSPRACHYDTLRRAHNSFLTRCNGWRKNDRTDHPISYLDTLIKTGSEIIEATLRRRLILFAGFVARLEDTRLPKCVMLGELVGGAGCVGSQEKEWMGCLLDGLRAFSTNTDQWTTAAQDEGEWRRTAEQGAERFMAK